MMKLHVYCMLEISYFIFKMLNFFIINPPNFEKSNESDIHMKYLASKGLTL